MTEIHNIRHLRVFSEVASCRSISGAAKRVHLSQPAVTQAIGKLEERIGHSLFARRPEGMEPTAIGSSYLKRVRSALEHLEAGAREVVRIAKRAGNDADEPMQARRIDRFDHLLTATHLRALIALAEAPNFSVAARQSGVSQPSIHRAARNLEAIAGTTFFRMSNEGVALTAAAKALVLHVRLALAELRQGHDEISALMGIDAGLIQVGSLPLARTSILPEAVDAMIATSSHVQIRVVDGTYGDLLNRLRHGELDFMIGALRDPIPADDVEQEALFDDPLAIVAGARHPLADTGGVNIEETLDFPWVAPPRSTPAGTYLYETLRIHERPRTPVRVVSSSLIFLRGLLTTGDYLTIISTHQVRHELESGLFVTLNVALERSERTIGLTFRKGWRPTPSQDRFLQFVRKVATRTIEEKRAG